MKAPQPSLAPLGGCQVDVFHCDCKLLIFRMGWDYVVLEYKQELPSILHRSSHLSLPTCTHLPVSLPMSCLCTYAELIFPLIHKISSSCLLKDLTSAFLLFSYCIITVSVYKIIPISIKHALNIFNFFF